MKKNTKNVLFIMILATIFTLTGCAKSTVAENNSEETSSTKQGTLAEKTTNPTQPKSDEKITSWSYPTADEVQEGGNFVISNGTEPASLDPQQIEGEPELRIYYALFEGLVQNDPLTAKPIPGLAESWDISDDETVITFHLRKSTWSDGTPITAHDFVWSWQRELDPNTAAPYAWFPEMFLKGAAEYAAGEVGADGLGVKALDDYTLQVTLVGPLPYGLEAFAHFTFAVLPQHCIEEYGDAWTQPGNLVSNGPFVLENHVSQSYISCVKNDNYWDADNVHLDKITYFASDDENTNYNMYIDGESDWLTSISTDQINSAEMRDDFKSSAKLADAFYVINCDAPELKNVEVRQAISYAIDRESMVENIVGSGIPSWGLIPDMEGYDSIEFPFDDYDEACQIAQEKLADAGYPNGIGFPDITILYNSNESNKKIAELIQANLKDVLGIKVILENQEWGTFISNRDSGQFQIARDGWIGDYQDPNTFLDMFVTGGSMNGGNFSNEEFDSLIKQASSMSDGPERMEILHRCEDILVNQEQAVIPFYFLTKSQLIDTNKWGGWYPNIMDEHPVKYIYLKK
ncbi:MAG: peptide ABC transporter substrate-binding protein [Sphaerochaeta sp.]